MIHAFNIYPALLVLTPVAQRNIPELEQQEEEDTWVAENDGYFTSCPQTYWGDCIFTADQKQLMLSRRNDVRACPVQEKINGRMNVLEPAKFKGQHYTITYIPVLN
jgi:hypothetical protein